MAHWSEYFGAFEGEDEDIIFLDEDEIDDLDDIEYIEDYEDVDE